MSLYIASVYCGRYLLALALIFASVAKLRKPYRLALLDAFWRKGAPRLLAVPLTFTVCAFEAVASICLFINLGAEYLRWPLVFFFVLASGILTVALSRGYRGPCGCFGHSDEAPLGIWHVARAMFLLCLVSTLWVPVPLIEREPKLACFLMAAFVLWVVIMANSVNGLRRTVAPLRPLREAQPEGADISPTA